MAAPRPRIALVDIGGVLVKVHRDRVVGQLAEAAGIEPHQAETALFGDDRKSLLDRGVLPPEQWAQEALAAAGVPVNADSVQWLQHRWCDIFSVHPGSDALITTLRSAGLKIVLASNTDPLHFGWLEQHIPAVGSADDAALSFRLGTVKPHPSFYEDALNHVGAEPTETLFLDDKEINVGVAASLGIRALRVPADYDESWCRERLAAAAGA